MSVDVDVPSDKTEVVVLDPSEHVIEDTVSPMCIAAEPTAPTGSTTLDERTGKIFRGHHCTSSVAGLATFGGETAVFRPTPEFIRGLEGVYGDTNYQPLSWLRKALTCASGVARLGPNKYTGTESGFVIDGSWIGESWRMRRLLLTNSHVCTDLPDVAGKWPYIALKPEETTVAFFEVGLGEPLTAKPLRLVATSAPKELDYTLLELDVVPDGVLPTLNTAPIASPGRVNILGHPLGGEMTVSIQDNEIREFEGSYIRYVTPTREGSSGSPVFDQSWNVVALHHAGIASRKTNEGILMAPILEHVKAKI